MTFDEKIQSHNSYGVVSCTGTGMILYTVIAEHNFCEHTGSAVITHINQEASLVVDILATSY
jgi:hypothetical protein